MQHLREMYSSSKNASEYFRSYFSHINELLMDLDTGAINSVVECFLKAREERKTIFFAGNGGSAATASHFAQDLGEVGRKAGKRGFKTLSLTENISLLSAVGNDYGFDQVFTIPLVELFNPGDVLVAISASGNSPNVIKAIEFARDAAGETVGLVGFDGGRMKDMCDHVIHVRTDVGSYGPVEDVHMAMDHLITSYLILRLSE